MKFWLILLFTVGCSSSPLLPIHSPIRSELVNNSSASIHFVPAHRVRGAQSDAAASLDKTPYQAKSYTYRFGYESRGLPWSSHFLHIGPDSPLDLGLKIQPYGFDGSSFKVLLQTHVGMVLSPTKVDAKDIPGDPKKVRKGLITGWNWSAVFALGYRFSPLWISSLGVRRSAFSTHHRFSDGIDDEWTINGQQMAYFFDQGLDFSSWRVDISLFYGGIGLADQDPDLKFGSALTLSFAW
tara:strand:- start:39436 stop:40152 length:717 start_codon:yes stop_codon:yes gene_type:complete